VLSSRKLGGTLLSRLLREKLLPEHSPITQGAAHPPPETLTAGTGGPFAVSRWVSLFDSPHTHSVSGASSSLRLDPRFPEPESPTRLAPDEFTEWHSSVEQLKLGASGEGPGTKKSLGNSTLTISVPAPHKFSKWQLIERCY